MRGKPTGLLMILFAIVLLCCATISFAQTFDLDNDREPIISLDGLWRFHPGDDMRWADRELNDSNWPQLRSDRPWTKQGYPNLSGFAWYRFKLHSKDGSRPKALILNYICTGYQVYLDGKLIGSSGSSEPTMNPIFPDPPIKPLVLPVAVSGSQTYQIAVRIWNYPAFTSWLGGGPLSGGNLAGDPALLAKHLQLLHTNFASLLVNEYAFVQLASMVGFTVLALFLFRPSDREYLWFSILILAVAADVAFNLILNLGSMAFPAVRMAGEACFSLSLVAALIFFSTILNTRRTFFWWLAFTAATINPLTVALFYFHWSEIGTSYLVLLLCRLPSYLWIIYALTAGALRRDVTAQLLVGPSLLYYGLDILDLITFANDQYGAPIRLIDFNPVLAQAPYPLHLNDIFYYLFMFALLLFLVRRFSLARKEESRLATEMDAARSIQFLSVPGAAQETPGFDVDTVYLPATEVGGDFFRVQPEPDGSLLVVVGDVSGKGLKAAMTVSTIIGALRGCTVRDPASVLAYLNKVLYGQISGFATCCVALIASDGDMTLANAGHLSPYLDGEELPLQSGLPLGLHRDESYDNRKYKLGTNRQLMFVSDGVVEACNKQGQLYGFDRTQKISSQPAAVVAKAAQLFGQDDDITVLTITLKTPLSQLETLSLPVAQTSS